MIMWWRVHDLVQVRTTRSVLMQHSACLVVGVVSTTLRQWTTQCSSRHSVNRNVTQVSHDPAHLGMVAARPTRTTIHVFDQSPAAHHMQQQMARSQGPLRAPQMALVLVRQDAIRIYLYILLDCNCIQVT